MNLAQWLDKIENLHPVKWDLGLGRVGEVGKRLEVIKPAPIVFLVAGTNGKGSTCEYLEQFCLLKGIRVGKTISPHFHEFNERIIVDGQSASSTEICAAFESIEDARGDISLSYFEFAALAALLIFKDQNVEVAVLEIGLGGRLDAMNIVDADVSIITQIAMDHESWLGNSLDQIAREKAGIMRQGKPCVIAGEFQPASLDAHATEMGVDSFLNGADFGLKDGHAWYSGRNRQQVEINNRSEGKLPAQSAIAAVQAFTCAGFDITETEFRLALERTTLPGRMQWLRENVLLDVAHNPNAAEYLKSRLLELPEQKVIHAVVGMYADKDCRTVFSVLEDLISHWYFADMNDARAAPARELQGYLSEHGGCVSHTYDKVSAAYASALESAGEDDLVLVFGSFPVVASILELTNRNQRLE